MTPYYGKSVVDRREKREQHAHTARGRLGVPHAPRAVCVSPWAYSNPIVAIAHHAVPVLQKQHLTGLRGQARVISFPNTARGEVERYLGYHTVEAFDRLVREVEPTPTLMDAESAS